jgi:hypothetical protein
MAKRPPPAATRPDAAEPTPAARLAEYKRQTATIEAEMFSTRGLNEQATVDGVHASSRLGHMHNDLERQAKELDDEIARLLGLVDLAGQDRAHLHAQVDAAKAALAANIAKYEQQLAQRRVEFAEQEEVLKSELKMYQGELALLREFQAQRAQMEEELRQMDQTLLRNRQVHQETMEQFEAQLQREHDIYVQENQIKVRAAEQAAVNITDECLQSVAVRCIQDCQAVSHQLRATQGKSQEIANSNLEMIAKIEALKRESRVLAANEKGIVDETAKYRQKIEGLKVRLAEGKAATERELVSIEAESVEKIALLGKEAAEVEKENTGLERQAVFLRQRTGDVEGQRRFSLHKQSQLMRLMTATAPVLLGSFQSDEEAEKPPALQNLMARLNDTIQDDEVMRRTRKPEPPVIEWRSVPVQTVNPNIKFF